MLLSDLLKGVGIGMLAAIIFILRLNYRAPYKVFEEEIGGRKEFFVKFSHQLTFINKGKITQLLHRIPAGSKVHLDAGQTHTIDKDVLELLNEYKKAAKYQNIELVTEGIADMETISSIH